MPPSPESNDGGQANVFLLNTTQIPDTFAPYLPRIEQAPDRFPTADPTVIRVQVFDNSSWNIAQFNTTTLEYRVDGGAVNVVPMVYAGGNVNFNQMNNFTVGKGSDFQSIVPPGIVSFILSSGP